MTYIYRLIYLMDLSMSKIYIICHQSCLVHNMYPINVNQQTLLVSFRRTSLIVALRSYYSSQHISKSTLTVILTEFDFSIVSQQNVLSLDVAVNDPVGMQICQAAKDLSTEVSNPLFPQRVCLGRPDQVGNGASATEFKYNPKLVIFA